MKNYIDNISIKTPKEDLINITNYVINAVRASGIKNGHCVVFCPHTTAGITVNENADPDVVKDMLFALNITYPDRPEFEHFEGNSNAHLKSSFVGCQQTFIINDGHLLLGMWQGIYFCEFDGPRNRQFIISIVGHWLLEKSLMHV